MTPRQTNSKHQNISPAEAVHTKQNTPVSAKEVNMPPRPTNSNPNIRPPEVVYTSQNTSGPAKAVNMTARPTNSKQSIGPAEAVHAVIKPTTKITNSTQMTTVANGTYLVSYIT